MHMKVFYKQPRCLRRSRVPMSMPMPVARRTLVHLAAAFTTGMVLGSRAFAQPGRHATLAMVAEPQTLDPMATRPTWSRR